MALTVIGTRMSRTFRVLWMLEELGLDYTHTPAAPRSDTVRDVNPQGKIPVLVEDGFVLRDSTAILTYLADKHGALTFPAGSPERAQQDALTFRILDEIDALLWTAARHSFILPEEMRVPEVKESLKSEFACNLQGLSEEIEGPFLMGETLTIPDLILCHCGGWAMTAKFPEAPRAFKDYAKNLRSRPAFERAAARD
ncbi:glutathione S-transferase family protein [Litorisediminicola beolgyonensis]|uniref:Glutathione S-transferase family protein n=1 Tax=Litorisediminicola beolgyonensis TaxID=1173614 RepID=A0ABW3ZCJ4_9RHOB